MSYPIGWCRVKLFHYEDAGVARWKLMTGDCVYRLNPGSVPKDVTTEDIDITSGMCMSWIFYNPSYSQSKQRQPPSCLPCLFLTLAVYTFSFA